jgi:hypothetical protein
MCGLVDFDALRTSVIRLAGLSIAGITTYTVCKTVSLFQGLCRRRGNRRDKVRVICSAESPLQRLNEYPSS